MQPVNLLIDSNVQAGDERRGIGIWVVQLEPVAAALPSVGEPFIDDKLREGRRFRGFIEFAKRRLGRCPAVRRADNRRADGPECYGINALAIGIKQRNRIARLIKAKAGSQPVALHRAAPDTKQASLAKCCTVRECERVVITITQRPAREINGRLSKILQFDKVWLR